MKPINELPPFKRFCITIGNLPSSYVDSMSYYECLMWLCKYLKDTVVPTINENAAAVNELINWFNNLDVQDEIDKKLDEMVESGELQPILDSIVNSNGFNLSTFKTDNNTWQEALESILDTYDLNKYVIYLPKDQEIDSDLTINKPNITLKDGIFNNAKLVLDYTTVNTDEFTLIDNIKFIGNSSIGIEVKSAYYPTITNCVFNNSNDSYSYGIVLKNVPSSFQNSRRVIITNNQFKDCSYGLYSDNEAQEFGSSGDVIFTNNQVDVKIGGIHTVGVDGHVISNNVFFLPGYAREDLYKKDNIYIEKSNFTEINSNSIFEAGRNGIRIIDTPSFIISNNNIAWSGQNEPASAIYTSLNATQYDEYISKICDNNITYPTLNGIDNVATGQTSGLLTITNNTIVGVGSSRYYYGTTDLSSLSHYSINQDNIRGSLVKGNLSFPTYSENIETNSTYNYIDEYNYNNTRISHTESLQKNNNITVTDLSSIDLKGLYDVIVLNPNTDSTFDFSKIQNATNGQTLTIFQYANHTITWVTSSSVKYDKNANLSTSRYSSKTFIFVSNLWIELSEKN